ncbi:sel1 repeat family protein, partial [Mesorhizobium sp. M8A.F.Ca.ET.181.01.1.1]
MKWLRQGVVARVAVAAALMTGMAAHAQDRVAKSNDPETQTAVADYNAGN